MSRPLWEDPLFWEILGLGGTVLSAFALFAGFFLLNQRRLEEEARRLREGVGAS